VATRLSGRVAIRAFSRKEAALCHFCDEYVA
jgi:hypothetical protein